MKLLSKEIKNSEHLYEGFIQGSETDKDVIARACGYLNGDLVCSVKAKLEDEQFEYSLNIDYSTSGEQKLLELEDIDEISKKIGVLVSDLENAYDVAKKNKVSQANHVLVLSKLFQEYSGDLFSLNCWYEGDITLTRKNKTTKEVEKLIENRYESEQGLEGVFGSIQEIHDYYKKDEFMVELLEWLLEDFN